MKKIFYSIMVLGVVLSSCDPMEDIYTEIDAQPRVITGEVDYTLTDEDYDELGLNFVNFNSVDDAKSMIPGLLTDKYPVWGKGSLATVSFKRYSPIKTYRAPVYTLSDQEHNDITGNTYGNFDRDYHIYDYLDAKYPNPSEGDFYSLRYNYYSGTEVTLTDGFAYENGEWTRFPGFTVAQYNAMGEGYPNFSSADEANAKIPIALLDVYKFDAKVAGDIVLAMYELYVGGGVTESYTSSYVFDGTSWSKYNNVANETIKFGHDGNTWVPDNTIKISVGGAEVAIIANALSATYPGPTANVLQYGSFDRRAGGGNYWSDDMLLEGFNILLNTIDPSAADEQKYVITIVTYVGATVDETFSVIKTGGVWVYNN